MTVGIGVLCDGGATVVVASDTRGSYGPDSPVGTHEQIGKQFDFWPKFQNIHASVAGVGMYCQPFISELNEQMKNALPDAGEVQLEHIVNALREAQWRTWEPIVNHELKFQLGITRNEWIDKKEMSTAVVQQGKLLIKRTGLPVHILIGGFLGHGRPLLLRMTGIDDIEEEVNFAAIGSGTEPATRQLNKRGQNVHMSLARSLLHISEALRAAKRRDRMVGDPSAYLIVTALGSWRFPADAKLLADWRTAHRKDSRVLDGNSLAQEQVRKLLIPHVSPHARQSISQT